MSQKSDFWPFFKRNKLLTAFFVCALITPIWYKLTFPSASWRYKLTMVVETPEGLKTGSVVRETRAERQIRIGDCCSGSAGTAGEALVVDLGKRGVLFGLTEESDPVSYIFRGHPPATESGMNYYSHLKNAKANLLEKNYNLTFVKFTHLNDPLTVEEVDKNNLSKSFGDGVSIKEFTIETTDEPMTWGVVNSYLPWLQGLYGGLLDGSRLTHSRKLSNTLHVGHFQKDMNRTNRFRP